MSFLIETWYTASGIPVNCCDIKAEKFKHSKHLDSYANDERKRASLDTLHQFTSHENYLPSFIIAKCIYGHLDGAVA